jgi:DUF1680 family protein
VLAVSACVALGLAESRSQSARAPRSQYTITPVPFTDMKLTDEFWAPRIEINRTASIPFAFEQCELTGRVQLFERAAKVLGGEALEDKRPPGYPFDETDLYKVIEGAAYSLSVVPDPKLDAYVDGFIAKIADPGWARNEPVPSDLYRFLDKADSATLAVNGRPIALTLDKGYVVIDGTWTSGDTIALTLPMPVRRVVSNNQVIANRDRVALQPGPIVYAAEWPDNANGKVRNIVLPDASALTSEYRADLLNGVQVIRGRAVGLALNAQGTVERTEQAFMAIPYATWANRGRGQMAVWLARADAAAPPTPFQIGPS